MNILMLSWRGPKHPNAGGAEQSTHEHGKAWVASGHEVWWFAANYKDARRREDIDGVKIIRSGRQFFDVQIRAFYWYLFGEHPKFDLVVDQFHGIPFLTPLYVRTKKLAFIHEVAKEVWSLNQWPFPFNLAPAFLGPIIEPWIFKLFYKKVPFMTVSESTKKDLILWQIPEENVTVVHNGIDRRAIPKKLPPKEKKKTVMFLGAVAKDKGIEDALFAFREIEKIEDSWQYWVVGRAAPGMKKFIKSEASKLKIDEKLKYWGFVSDKKKFGLLARAHILINPSVHEGWGLVNIEANSVGTPVIAYDVPGVRDSVKDKDTGFLSGAGNPEGLVSNTLRLVGNPKIYRRIQKNALLWSKKFNWDTSTKESLKLLDSLV